MGASSLAETYDGLGDCPDVEALLAFSSWMCWGARGTGANRGPAALRSPPVSDWLESFDCPVSGAGEAVVLPLVSLTWIVIFLALAVGVSWPAWSLSLI